MAEFLVGTRAEMAEQKSALARAAGLPEFTRNAPGWTSELVEDPVESADRTIAALELTAECEPLLGRLVRVDGRDVSIRDASAKVGEEDLPQELKDVVRVRSVVALPSDGVVRSR